MVGDKEVVSEEQGRKIFTRYWQEISIIKKFNSSDLGNLMDQPIRRKIIDLLARGVEVNLPGSKETAVLHVLSASQINDILNKEMEEEVKKSNLYFHLQKLEDGGMIQTVAVIQNGRRFTSYFGRTARVFLIKYDEDNHDKKKLLDEEDEFIKLISKIQGDINEDHIKSVIRRAKTLYHDSDKAAVKEWIQKYEEELRESKIDIRHLHGLLHKILLFDDKTITALREFADLLDLDTSNLRNN